MSPGTDMKDDDFDVRRRLAMELDRAPETSRQQDDEILAAARRAGAGIRGRRRRFRPALAAAVVAGFLGAFVYLSLPQRPPVLRGDATVSGISPAQGARLEQAPERFDWPTLPEARGYELTLRDSSANLLWRSPPLDASSADLPDAVRQRLDAKGSFLWTVETEAGAVLGPYHFSVQ